MDITAGIIVYSLSLDTSIQTNISAQQDFPVESYELWEQGMPRSHVLYVIQKEKLLQDLAIWRKKFVICTGWIQEEELKGQELYWISVSDSITLYEIAGLVQHTFHQYFQWYIQVETLVRQRESLDSLVDTLYDFYKITACVATQSMEIAGICYRFSESNWWVDHGKMVSLGRVNELIADEDFHNCAEYDDAFLYLDEKQEWYYCYNFKINGQYQARLVSNVESHQKAHGIWKLIHDFGTCISDVYEDYFHQGQLVQYRKEWYDLVCSLIQGNAVNIRDLRRCAEQYQWKIEHKFQVILFQFQDGASEGVGMNYYRVQIKSLFCDCYVVQKKNRFICIRNLDRSKNKDDVYENQLPYFLRETLCKAGISNIFSDLGKLHRYFLEAERALQIGERIDSTQWYYSFADYVVPYMMEQCTCEFTAEDICHPAIAVLKEYDAKNEAHLLKSLKIFLQEQQNITRTSKLLDIHRTTFLVRLDRIRQLTGVNLNDYDTCLYLMISFEILKY